MNHNIMNIVDFVEKLEKEIDIPCYRHIKIDHVDGKKIPLGEKNDMTTEQINKNRGKGDWISIYLKHIPNLYVIDFDEKGIVDCPLYDKLNDDCVAYTTTTKGEHFYVYIKDIPKFTQQQKVLNCDVECDILKTNNCWEHSSRMVNGEIKEYAWNDIKIYFNEYKMGIKNASPPVSPPVSQNDEDEWGVIVDNDFPRCNKEEFLEYLNSIKPRWDNYDTYILIGHICFNNFEGDADGFNIWNAWCKKSIKYDKKTITSQWEYFRKQYDNGSNKVSYKKLIEFHILDYPPKNIYEKWYKSNVFMEEMNKICMYYTPASEVYYKSNHNNLTNTNVAKARDYFKMYSFEIKKEKFNPFDIWLNSIDRKNIDKIVFNPKGNCRIWEYNLWQGFNYKNTGEYDNSKIKKWLNLIHNIWADGDDDTYNYILNWFAQILQKPYSKNKVCLVLHSSVQGVGKSLILNMIGEIIGDDYYYSTSNLQNILGNFNGDAEGKLLVNLNETNWGGDKKMVGAFKEFITDESIVINRKNKNTYTIKNYSNTIITTNEDWIVSIDGNDRRFNIRECKNVKYDAEYYNEIADTPLQDIANFLYNRDITQYNPRDFIKSELHEAQVIKNFNSVESFYDNILNKEINMNGWELDDEIPKTEIYDLYKTNLSKNERQLCIVHFWREFKKVCPSVIIKKATGGKKGTMYIPCLIKAHEDWGKYKGL